MRRGKSPDTSTVVCGCPWLCETGFLKVGVSTTLSVHRPRHTALPGPTMKITRILSILTAAALAAVCNTATAAPGDLDLTFGGTGKIITNFGNVIGRSVTLQGDGKIVVAGGHASGSFAVVRHNSDGSLDSSFNGTGKVTTTFGSSDTSGASVVVQGDDKIVVAGRSNGGIALARYNTNGTLDTAFGNAGKVTTDFGLGVGSEGLSIALQNDGKIVVAGSSISGLNTDFALVRYNTNGSLDTSFNGTGKVTTDFGRNDDIGNSVAIQTDGKIVVSGFSGTGGGGNYFFATARYTANGGLDTSFNGTGKVTTQIGGTVNRAYGVAIQSDGKIVSAGYCNVGNTEDFALVRYNTNGSLDTSFNGTGKVTTAIGSSDDEGYSVAMLDNGKILVAGASQGDRSDMALVRYTEQTVG